MCDTVIRQPQQVPWPLFESRQKNYLKIRYIKTFGKPTERCFQSVDQVAGCWLCFVWSLLSSVSHPIHLLLHSLGGLLPTKWFNLLLACFSCRFKWQMAKITVTLLKALTIQPQTCLPVRAINYLHGLTLSHAKAFCNFFGIHCMFNN